MLVDPNTGEFIEPSYAPEGGTAMAMLSAMPGIPTVMAWNAQRGANTIIRGGYSKNSQNRNRAFKAHTQRRSFGRFSSVHNVDTTHAPKVGQRFLGKSDKMWTPFNMLAPAGNVVANAFMKRTIGAEAGSGSARARSVIGSTESGQFFSPGFFARQTAASRIASGGKFSASTMRESIGMLDPKLANELSGIKGRLYSGQDMSHLVGASMDGSLSLKASGYLRGAAVGMPSTSFQTALIDAGKEAYMTGATRATQHLAAGGIERVAGQKGFRIVSSQAGEMVARRAGLEGVAAGQKLGGLALRHAVKEGGIQTAGAILAGTAGGSLAMRAVPVIGQAMLAYDITKMALAGVTGTLDLAVQGAKSFKGSIDKPVMGMGWKDNTVAATSRGRGVMAIQNSRLNARSVLGSEAGPIAAHFG